MEVMILITGKMLGSQYRDPRYRIERRFCVYCSGELSEYDAINWHENCYDEAALELEDDVVVKNFQDKARG
jgi:hypothetical protein